MLLHAPPPIDGRPKEFLRLLVLLPGAATTPRDSVQRVPPHSTPQCRTAVGPNWYTPGTGDKHAQSFPTDAKRSHPPQEV